MVDSEGFDMSRLDAFADVPVVIDTRVGKRIMSLHQIVGITVGDTVSLDRPSGETLELYVGDVRLATAEVVVLDDRLAVRISEFGSSEPAAAVGVFDETAMPPHSGLDPRLPGPPIAPLSRISRFELCLHVSLGKTILPLKTIFKLTPGSVLEIGRSITDPVDVVVNGRVIAQGQVVTCGGSYGVKLTRQLYTRSEGPHDHTAVDPGTN